MDRDYIPLRACPVCEVRSGTVLGQLTYALFDDLEIPGTKTLLRCGGCGMMYDDVAFSEEQLNEYYRRNEHYAVSNIGGTGSLSDDNCARYDRILDSLRPLSDELILDFGCGQGGFISRCLHRGFRAVGIEPTARSRAAAREAGLTVYESWNALITQNPLSKMHIVVLSHVLEHLMHPRALLQELSEYAHDAMVYVEVPDADSYLLPKEVLWQEMYFEHLSHFRKQNIADLAGRCGITIITEEKISFSALQKGIQCRSLIGRLSANRKSTGASASPGSEHNLVSLPAVSIESFPKDGCPLSLWGVSQYAMLLLGSCPELFSRLHHLFDASPAKIGRSIRGMLVEPSDKISSLSDEYILLIPRSPSLVQMRSQLQKMGFKGQVFYV